MLSLHLHRRQPVLCHSPHATELQVQVGCAWVTVEQAGRAQSADAVLLAGDTLRLPPGARAVASGLPSATLAVLEHGVSFNPSSLQVS